MSARARSAEDERPTPKPVFLPGAGGDREFWAAVAERLPPGWEPTRLSWPGAGHEPADHRIGGFGDLIELVADGLEPRSDLVAQSMGGVVAIGIAVRHPGKVRRLVLVATSGGTGVAALGAADWREAYRAEYPHAAPWIWEEHVDFTDALGGISAPTLLIWGDCDPLSPPAVGRHLAALIPGAALQVLPGGTHAMAHDRPDEVAALVLDHLAAT